MCESQGSTTLPVAREPPQRRAFNATVPRRLFMPGRRPCLVAGDLSGSLCSRWKPNSAAVPASYAPRDRSARRAGTQEWIVGDVERIVEERSINAARLLQISTVFGIMQVRGGGTTPPAPWRGEQPRTTLHAHTAAPVHSRGHFLHDYSLDKTDDSCDTLNIEGLPTPQEMQNE